MTRNPTPAEVQQDDVSVRPGRCGHEAPRIVDGSPVFCSLRAGHTGWHEDGSASWSIAARPSADTETLRVLREIIAEYRSGQLWSSQAIAHVCAVLDGSR